MIVGSCIKVDTLTCDALYAEAIATRCGVYLANELVVDTFKVPALPAVLSEKEGSTKILVANAVIFRSFCLLFRCQKNHVISSPIT